jgi:hypothetical protein
MTIHAWVAARDRIATGVSSSVMKRLNSRARIGSTVPSDQHSRQASPCKQTEALEKIGNPEPLGEQRDCGACDALLFYVNQVGTLSEALEAYRLVRSAGWSITIR